MTPPTDLHEQLTALQFGELSPADEAALRLRLATEPEAQAWFAELEATVAQLRIAFEDSPVAPTTLGDDRLAAILAAAAEHAPATADDESPDADAASDAGSGVTTATDDEQVIADETGASPGQTGAGTGGVGAGLTLMPGAPVTRAHDSAHAPRRAATEPTPWQRWMRRNAQALQAVAAVVVFCGVASFAYVALNQPPPVLSGSRIMAKPTMPERPSMELNEAVETGDREAKDPAVIMDAATRYEAKKDSDMKANTSTTVAPAATPSAPMVAERRQKAASELAAEPARDQSAAAPAGVLHQQLDGTEHVTALDDNVAQSERFAAAGAKAAPLAPGENAVKEMPRKSPNMLVRDAVPEPVVVAPQRQDADDAKGAAGKLSHSADELDKVMAAANVEMKSKAEAGRWRAEAAEPSVQEPTLPAPSAAAPPRAIATPTPTSRKTSETVAIRADGVEVRNAAGVATKEWARIVEPMPFTPGNLLELTAWRTIQPAPETRAVASKPGTAAPAAQAMAGDLADAAAPMLYPNVGATSFLDDLRTLGLTWRLEPHAVVVGWPGHPFLTKPNNGALTAATTRLATLRTGEVRAPALTLDVATTTLRRLSLATADQPGAPTATADTTGVAREDAEPRGLALVYVPKVPRATVSLTAIDLSLGDVLHYLLLQATLRYRVEGSLVVVYRLEETLPPAVAPPNPAVEQLLGVSTRSVDVRDVPLQLVLTQIQSAAAERETPLAIYLSLPLPLADGRPARVQLPLNAAPLQALIWPAAWTVSTRDGKVVVQARPTPKAAGAGIVLLQPADVPAFESHLAALHRAAANASMLNAAGASAGASAGPAAGPASAVASPMPAAPAEAPAPASAAAADAAP